MGKKHLPELMTPKFTDTYSICMFVSKTQCVDTIVWTIPAVSLIELQLMECFCTNGDIINMQSSYIASQTTVISSVQTLAATLNVMLSKHALIVDIFAPMDASDISDPFY